MSATHKETSVRQAHARLFQIRKRNIETRLIEMQMKKKRMDVQIKSLESQRDNLVVQIISLRSQLETINKELE